AFLGGGPHVIVTMMGRSSAEFGLWFALGATAYMGGNFVAARWSARYGVDTMIRAGIAIAVPSALVGIAWVIVRPDDGPLMIFLPQMAASIGSGFLLPNSIAGAVSVRPQAAGAAAGITGFLQMSFGALAVQTIGHLLEHATPA